MGAEITAEVRADAEDESKSVLKVTLSIPETGSRQAIPDGLLGFVTVQLAEDAQRDSQIVLKTRGSAMTTGPPPRPVGVLTIHDGVISVGGLSSPAFSICISRVRGQSQNSTTTEPQAHPVSPGLPPVASRIREPGKEPDEWPCLLPSSSGPEHFQCPLPGWSSSLDQ